MGWEERLSQESFRDALRDLLDRVAHWNDQQSLNRVLPHDELEEKIAELRADDELEKRFKGPFEESWGRVWKNLKSLDKSPAQLMGKDTTQALIDGVAEMEPKEEAVRAFFEQKAVGELLSNLLYTGIQDFFAKMNPLRSVLKDSLASIPFASRFSSGLLGSVTGNFEKAVDRQLKVFLRGFSKVATRRAADFVLSNANRTMFREMRIALAKKLLDTDVSKLAGDVEQSKLDTWRDRIWKGLNAEFKKPEKQKMWDERLQDLYAKHGDDTPAELLEKWGIGKAWRAETHKNLAPFLQKLVKDDSIVEWLERFIRDDKAVPAGN